MATGKLIVTDARQYRIHDLIAKGAFSEVYRCTAVATGKVYAIKIVDRELAAQHHMEDALIREVNAMQVAGSSPYVASLVDKLVSTHNYYIIMNVAEGGTLLDLIRDHTQSSFLRLHTGLYMRQLLLGLAALHARNIVHRDIKPENILLDQGRTQVMISDFGFACYAPPGRPLHRTCGTLKYCAPELLRESPSYDGRKVDIWAAGVTLYVMLFRTHPYKAGAGDADALLACIRARPYLVPHEIDPDARDMLSKMLLVDPEQRWSAEELLRHPWMRLVANTAVEEGAEGKTKVEEAGEGWGDAVTSRRAQQSDGAQKRNGEASHDADRRAETTTVAAAAAAPLPSPSSPASSSSLLHTSSPTKRQAAPDEEDEEEIVPGAARGRRSRAPRTMSDSSSFAPICSDLTEYVDDGLYMATQSDFHEPSAPLEKDTASYCYSRATAGSHGGATTPSTSSALRHISSPLAASLSTLTVTTDGASSSTYLHSFVDDGVASRRSGGDGDGGAVRHGRSAVRSGSDGGEDSSSSSSSNNSSSNSDDENGEGDGGGGGGRTSFMGILGFCCTALYLARLIGYVMLFWWPLLLMAAMRLALGPRVAQLRLPRLVRRVMAILPGPPRRRRRGRPQQQQQQCVAALPRRRLHSAPHGDSKGKGAASGETARRRSGRAAGKTRNSLPRHDVAEDTHDKAVTAPDIVAGRKALRDAAPTRRASPGLTEDDADKLTNTASTEHSAELPAPRHATEVCVAGSKTTASGRPCSPGAPFPRLRDRRVAEDFPTALTHDEVS